MTQPRSFLLVDDDIDDVLIFQETLKKIDESIHFFYVSNGKEAIDFLTEHAGHLPQIIFLDINMPKMDGKECLKLIKQDENLKHLPVIMYTTSSQSKDIEEAMMGGALCFITKPSGINELRTLLTAIVKTPVSRLTHTLQALENNISSFIVCS